MWHIILISTLILGYEEENNVRVLVSYESRYNVTVKKGQVEVLESSDIVVDGIDPVTLMSNSRTSEGKRG